MKLIDELRREHELIDRTLGSFRTYVEMLKRGEASLPDALRFVEFFEVYAGDFHHEKEESALFPALESEAMLPRRGPIETLLNDHQTIHATLAEIREVASREALDGDGLTLLATLATHYSHALWQHIDAENSVLFPESEARLLRSGVSELPMRAATAAEVAAEELGLALTTKYLPMEPDSIRGDGCIMCPTYGVTCQGIEREWWNQFEWEEMDDHIGAS